MEKEYLFQFLYYALLEMREDAYEKDDKKVFRLTDLFHNLPLQLKNVSDDSRYKELLDEIESRAESHIALKKWVERVKKHVDYYSNIDS